MRYVRKDDRPTDVAACRYCGTRWGGDRDADGIPACEPTSCKACGIRTCMGYGLGSGSCPACYVGKLAGWSGADRPCQRARCTGDGIAIERKRTVCREHLTINVVAQRDRSIAAGDKRGELLGMRPVFDELDRETLRLVETDARELLLAAIKHFGDQLDVERTANLARRIAGVSDGWGARVRGAHMAEAIQYTKDGKTLAELYHELDPESGLRDRLRIISRAGVWKGQR